jgi:Na+(H+)/acetate symporter ActP
MMVPMIGGIVEMVLSTASIAGGALFAPIIWTLYSKRQTATSVVSASLSGLILSLGLKLFSGPLLGFKLSRLWETALGVGIPLIVLMCWELYYRLIKSESPAAAIFQALPVAATVEHKAAAHKQNVFGIRIIAVAIGIVGAGISVLGLLAERGTVATVVGIIILILAFPLWRSARDPVT